VCRNQVIGRKRGQRLARRPDDGLELVARKAAFELCGPVHFPDDEKGAVEQEDGSRCSTISKPAPSSAALLVVGNSTALRPGKAAGAGTRSRGG
jgi:hypothetical protein